MATAAEQKQMVFLRLQGQTFTRIRPSVISPKGVGTFAIVDIPEGTPLFLDCRHSETVFFTNKELASLPLAVRKVLWDFCVHTKTGISVPICGMNNLPMKYYLNHSKEAPNLKNAITAEGVFYFTTRRLIKEGEELCWDYSAVEDVSYMDSAGWSNDGT